MSKIGVMVCGHGSRDDEAIGEFASVAAGIAARLPHYPVRSGFLEFARPVIRDGLDELRAIGCERILAIPGMLFAAGHVKNDVPSVLNEYAAKHRGFAIEYGRELAVEMKLLQAAAQRIEEAERRSGRPIAREDTLLMVVGRGTSDPDANSNISKVARMLWEGMGFGWCEVSYSGVTFPLVGPGLEHAAKLGYKRIIVFPYFLFTGVLVKRIYRIADQMAARHPEIEFLKAEYLNDHPLVLDCFAERVEEILVGQNNMNCQMCKYRDQVLGFEAEVGLPQEGHHHHVEGIGTNKDRAGESNGGSLLPLIDAAPAHRHAHAHSHDHDHHHGHDHDGCHCDDHEHEHLHDDCGCEDGHSHTQGCGHGQHRSHAHTHVPHPHADHRHGPRRRNPESLD